MAAQDRRHEEWREEPPEQYGRYPGGRPPGGSSRVLTYAAVAIAAAVAAAIAVLLLTGSLTGSRPSAAPQAGPPAAGPGGGAFGGGGGGQLGGGGGGGGTLMMGGTVSAVSATSITLGGGSHTITAAITSSTQFTGVRDASGIKAGDRVTAEITGYGTGHPMASAIQDPAQGR